MAGGIEGLDKLMRQFGGLGTVIADETMENAVGASCKLVQAEAKMLCLVDTGELRRSIQVSVERQEERVVGSVFTNLDHAVFVEFGTGPKGQESHEGISPAVAPAYTQSPWWIHESQIDRETAEKYHWFYIDTDDGRFYQCTGQSAHPFLYPALKNNEERVTRNIANYISREIRKAVK